MLLVLGESVPFGQYLPYPAGGRVTLELFDFGSFQIELSRPSQSKGFPQPGKSRLPRVLKQCGQRRAAFFTKRTPGFCIGIKKIEGC